MYLVHTPKCVISGGVICDMKSSSELWVNRTRRLLATENEQNVMNNVPHRRHHEPLHACRLALQRRLLCIMHSSLYYWSTEMCGMFGLSTDCWRWFISLDGSNRLTVRLSDTLIQNMRIAQCSVVTEFGTSESCHSKGVYCTRIYYQPLLWSR